MLPVYARNILNRVAATAHRPSVRLPNPIVLKPTKQNLAVREGVGIVQDAYAETAEKFAVELYEVPVSVVALPGSFVSAMSRRAHLFACKSRASHMTVYIEARES